MEEITMDKLNNKKKQYRRGLRAATAAKNEAAFVKLLQTEMEELLKSYENNKELNKLLENNSNNSKGVENEEERN